MGKPSDFLFKKSWHPLSQKNQQRLQDAEKRERERDKEAQERAAELERESDRLKRASLLHKGKREREMAEGKVALSFMYTSPPGLDEAQKKLAIERERERAKEAQEAKEGARVEDKGGSHNRGGNRPESSAAPIWMRRREDLNSSQGEDQVPASLRPSVCDSKYELRHEYGGGRSPIRGGGNAEDENQQIIVCPDDDEDDGGGGNRVGPSDLAENRQGAEAEPAPSAENTERRRRRRKHHRHHKRRRRDKGSSR